MDIDLSDIADKTGGASPDVDLSDIATYGAKPTEEEHKLEQPRGPTPRGPTPPWQSDQSQQKEYPGFSFVKEDADTPAHYEAPNGQWVLPEEIDKAFSEHQQKIGAEIRKRGEADPWYIGRVREFLQGATIGHEPQLEAAISKGLSSVGLAESRPYREEVAINRALLEKYRQDHPNESMGVGFAGGAAGVMSAPQVLPARVMTAAGYLNPLRYMPAVQRWARMAPRAGEVGFDAAREAERHWMRQAAVQGGALGAPYGAVYAEGESNSPVMSPEWVGDIARGTATGVASGTALGPAFAGLGRYAAKGYNYLFDRPTYLAENAGKRMAASDVEPQAVIDQLVPQATPALQNVPQEQLANAVAMHQRGMSTPDIARETGIPQSALSPYFRTRSNILATPQNLLSATRNAAGDNYRLSMTPYEREARGDVALQGVPKEGAIDPEMTLRAPLAEQQGRIADELDRIVGGNFQAASRVAERKMDVEAKRIYQDVDREEMVHKAAQDLYENDLNRINTTVDNAERNLQRALDAQNADAARSQSTQMNLMGKSQAEVQRIKANNAARQQQLQDDVTNAHLQLLATRQQAAQQIANLTPPPSRLDVADVLKNNRAVADREFGSNSESWKKFHNAIDEFFETTPVESADHLGRVATRPDYSRPIRNISDFQAARGKLNRMISQERRSPEGDQYLVKRLRDFKEDLNQRAYQFSSKLQAADKKWAEGASAQEILEEAQGAALNLGTKATDQLEYFKKLGKEQKKLFQIGFADALKNHILNKPEGSKTIVALVEKPGTRQIIREILGNTQADRLLTLLNRERSLFLSGANALSGSRTTPLAEDLRMHTELAHGAAAAMTGAPHSMISHGRNLLGYTLRSNAAAQRNAFNMASEPGAAIRNAYAVQAARRNALARNRLIDQLAQYNALGTQGVMRQSLPQGTPYGQ